MKKNRFIILIYIFFTDKFEKTNLKHRKLLLCLIMTASDLSDQTKPWDSTKHIAVSHYLTSSLK